MALRINYNLAASVAQRSLGASQDNYARQAEKLAITAWSGSGNYTWTGSKLDSAGAESTFERRPGLTSGLFRIRELIFDNVKVPKENLLPNVSGIKGPLGCLSTARYGIAWGAIGAALDCYDTALRYAKERIQFGRPIGQFQLQQKKLAEMSQDFGNQKTEDVVVDAKDNINETERKALRSLQ